MAEIMYIFPGQGSQYKGIGKALYSEFDVATDIYDHANEVLGYTGFFIPAKDTPNEMRAFKTDRIVYSYREFDKESAKWSEYK